MVAKKSGWLRRHRVLSALVITAIVGVLVVGAGVAVVFTSPELAAQASDVLRSVIGDEATSLVETLVFQLQDTLHGIQYRVNPQAPAAPWAAAADPAAAPAATAVASVPAAIPAHTQSGAGLPHPTAPTATPALPWLPEPLAPMGNMQGEAVWTPYLYGPDGQVIAYRAFLQPDPSRPYVVAAVVAFDLQATRLHLVLGSLEPASTVKVDRSGRMPAQDAQPGILLAAFNGGFKARHGHFGMMVNGTVVLPPRDGLGTVALYQDGHIAMGTWGTQIVTATGMVAWRQNGPLIIDKGAINPHTADIAPQDWGYTVNGVTATFRSALGLSSDGRTLYYMAGQGLTLPVLARAMQDTGVTEAMQLDINNYWVHFEAFQPGLTATPLLSVMGSTRVSRFLNGDNRDYFYVTIAP